MISDKKTLIQKYNVPGPRYTSYPTVPYWNTPKDFKTKWKDSLIRSFNESNISEGISLYIHFPFCKSLCTFCGCNKRITKNHSLEKPYVDALIEEWLKYVSLFPQKPVIKSIHFGGGTPTFFDPKQLDRLLKNIFSCAEKRHDHDFSLEAHPGDTSEEHLKTLNDWGFKRISFGIQDYDPIVQKVINRIQSFKQIYRVHNLAKKTGYDSICHDLVFGLPKQTVDTVIKTAEFTIGLKPERIAFYSYAHVPWIKGNGQRGFDEKDLPKDHEKRLLYETGKSILTKAGYKAIGMDHFALPQDSLYKASINKNLHRNFMGYTHIKTQLNIGLGVSSISDSWYGFAQNEKNLDKYYLLLKKDLPVTKGHILNKEDLIIRKHILNIMCKMETSWIDEHEKFDSLKETINTLKELKDDELLYIDSKGLVVNKIGEPFLRNICMAFDMQMYRQKPGISLFSTTI